MDVILMAGMKVCYCLCLNVCTTNERVLKHFNLLSWIQFSSFQDTVLV